MHKHKNQIYSISIKIKFMLDDQGVRTYNLGVHFIP